MSRDKKKVVILRWKISWRELDSTEERIVNLMTQQQKLSRIEGERLKKIKKQSISELQDNFNKPNTCLIEIPKGGESLKKKKKAEETMVVNFPDDGKLHIHISKNLNELQMKELSQPIA